MHQGIDQPDLDPVVLQDIHQIFDQIKAEVPVLAQLDCSVLDIFWAADVNGGWKVQFTFFIEDELDRHEPFQSVPGLFDDFLEFLLFQTHLFPEGHGLEGGDRLLAKEIFDGKVQDLCNFYQQREVDERAGAARYERAGYLFTYCKGSRPHSLKSRNGP